MAISETKVLDLTSINKGLTIARFSGGLKVDGDATGGNVNIYLQLTPVGASHPPNWFVIVDQLVAQKDNAAGSITIYDLEPRFFKKTKDWGNFTTSRIVSQTVVANQLVKVNNIVYGRCVDESTNAMQWTAYFSNTNGADHAMAIEGRILDANKLEEFQNIYPNVLDYVTRAKFEG